MKTHEFDVEGMSCQHCVRSVEEALAAVVGIGVAQVQVGHVHVEAADDVKLDTIASAITAAGFSVVRR